MSKHQFKTLTCLRVYLRRGDNKRGTRWWGRLFEKPLSTYLVHAALRSGITHASVHLGHVGFAKDASSVAYDLGELPLTTLPVCVELVAPRRLLEQFLRDEAKHLGGATLLMTDGVELATPDLSLVVGADGDTHPVHYTGGTHAPLHVERGGVAEEHDETPP
jgi:PII-like signaling protein